MNMIKILVSSLLLLSLYLGFVSCSASCCNYGENRIPEEIIEKGNKFIISKTGAEFFNSYIKHDRSGSQELESGYFLTYDFKIPELNFIDEEIRFSVDSLGNILTTMEIAGIPDCVLFPSDCEFNIDKSEAEDIARQNGLEAGIKEWSVDFKWNPEYKKYVWQIISTLKETEGGNGKRANGMEMVIHPGTGNIIDLREWRIN